MKITGWKTTVIGALLLALAWSYELSAQPPVPDSVQLADSVAIPPPAPATSLVASDHKYDDASAIELSWVPSIDDQLMEGRVTGYKLYRTSSGGQPRMIAELPAGSNFFQDESVDGDSSYNYYIEAISAGSVSRSIVTASISPEAEWFNFNRKYLFLIALLVSVSVIYFIETARRGKALFIRKIAGLEAVDDAIGRATEMGRPILFIPGIQDMDNPQTIAGLTILGHVSRTIAEYDTKITMPVSRSLVMTAARETIKTSYMTAGRPDAYNDDMVNYITDEQFGYVAAVDGIMVRQKPAACFYLGAFFAESLIMAETGNSIGAIQIAGTAMPAQLPFFVAACDFTLIGEELFAASAYLSNEPKQLGSLKGQDVGKGVAMAVILIGAVAATASVAWNSELATSVFNFLTSVFQTN
ncbi:MAG: fibronectin type III domain-containing protein [bacterium]|nr:fibronectin type III domain-containing protein [bacterium]